MHKDILITIVKTLVKTDKWIKSYHPKKSGKMLILQKFISFKYNFAKYISFKWKSERLYTKRLLSVNSKKVPIFSVLLIVKKIRHKKYSKSKFLTFSNCFLVITFINLFVWNGVFTNVIWIFFSIWTSLWNFFKLFVFLLH